ncbi:MAG: hypothetical protein MUF00_06585 [Gemmatimonadaceae bacterium]|jgi:hypothetical protein|nr:hypothetical protein [Gemmatimonadaceae bacterium]
MRAIGKWRPKQLFQAWGVYWAGLAAVSLPAPVIAMWRAYRAPEGVHGSITGGATQSELSLKVILDGASIYERTVGLLPLSLWLTVPPIVLTLLWMWRVRRGEEARAVASPSAIGEGAARTFESRAARESAPVHRTPSTPVP